MVGYYVKRILWVAPSIFILATFVFLLSNFTNKDPVDLALQHQGISFESSPNYKKLYKQEFYNQKKHLPLYYFSVLPSHYPDTLNFIVNPARKDAVLNLLKSGYPITAINDYEKVINEIESDTLIHIFNIKSYSPKDMLSAGWASRLSKEQKTTLVKIESQKVKFHWPSLRIHGFDNQFHYWIYNIIKGDWGESFVDGSEVRHKVGNALSWTVTLMGINLFLMFIIGIPIVFYAVYKGGVVGQIIEWVSLLVYAIPIFWLATLIQVYLMSPEYGMKIFPSFQEDYFASPTFSSIVNQYITKYMPAVICLLFADLAVFIRLLKGNFLKESLMPYVSTAYSKGASKFEVLYRHVLPNSIIPLITIFIGSIPLILTGSLIVEVVFNIPGMGRLLYHSISRADWAVVYFIVLLIGIATTIFYMIGDLLYQYFDPRIKLTKDAV